jgi:hypothetical protein
MPRRSEPFQELITSLTQTLRQEGDLITPTAMLKDNVVPGARREVDICVETEIDGHKVVMGIECRAWKRKQSVEWVEAMYGKHSHLPIDATALVSSSGFTPGALVLAEHLKIKAVTPQDVTPGFVGEVVNNLNSLWMKRFDLTPESMTVVFDPPIAYPDGQAADRVDLFPILATNMHRGDSTVICTAGDVLQVAMRNCIDLNQPAFRDATGQETQFTLAWPGTGLLLGGDQAYLLGGDDPQQPFTLRRVTQLEIKGRAEAHVVEMPLTHAEYEGTPFSAGTAVTGDDTMHWVVTEGEGGPRVGIRVLNASNPTDGQFFDGTWVQRAATPS